MKTPSHTSKSGFTLIELLTVIAIVAILSAILVPTVSQFRTLAKKTSDVNDLRNIMQASHMFAGQNGEKFVLPEQTLGPNGIVNLGGTDIVDVAAVLALGGELNEIGVWQSANENKPIAGGNIYTYTQNDDQASNPGSSYAVNDVYEPGHFSFDYVTGIATWMPSTTPVAFSRMENTGQATWGDTDVYGSTGGHIAFLNGSVTWYDNLENKLVAPDGNAASSIDDALPTGTTIRESEATVTAP